MPIKETLFGPQRYLTLRKFISTDQISDKRMYDEAGQKLGAYMEHNGMRRSGGWAVLYFVWNIQDKKAEIGIAFPVDNLAAVVDHDLEVVEIPRTKAAMDSLRGSYDGLPDVHRRLMGYMIEKGYDTAGLPAIAVEEYLVDPMSDPDPANWLTDIYYLHR